MKNRLTLENLTGSVFFLGALFCLVRSFSLCFSIDIWYDELFSVEFANRPVAELVGLTARDVHPPFYYLILRFFGQVFAALGFLGDGAGQVPFEVLCKMLSVLPFLVLFVYSLTTIRKQFGLLAAGAFSFAIMAMPQMPEYTTEIRMYSYAMLFVTAQLLHGYGLVRSFDGKNDPKWDVPHGIAMFLYSAAAAYTHYYAALASGIIYGLFFMWMLIEYIIKMKSSERKNLSFRAFGILVISMNMMLVSFVPWIGVLRSQAAKVSENYWILPVGFHSFLSAAKHLFEGYFGNDAVALFVGALFVLVIAALFVRTLAATVKDKKSEDIFTLCAFMVLPILVGVGVLASVIVRPVFVNRYMIPAYGCFWLSVCIMASNELKELKSVFGEHKEKLMLKTLSGVCGTLFLVLVLVVGYTDYRTFIWNEDYRKTEMEKTMSLFEEIGPETVIISNFDQVQALLSYYLNRNSNEYKVYLYQEEPEMLISETVPGLETIYDPVDVRNYLEGGREVLFLGSFNSREDILRDWKTELEVNSDDLGSFLMERYWFEDFRLRNY